MTGTAPAQGLTAAFAGSPLSGPAPLAVTFADLSTTTDPGGIVAWAWDFENDGTIDSTAQHPTFVYAANGTYDVRLTVHDLTHPPQSSTRTGYVSVGLMAFGLVHAPIGGAALTPAVSALVVSTPTDGDGVAIGLGSSSSGGCVVLQDPRLSGAGNGSSLRITADGRFPGSPETALVTLTATENATGMVEVAVVPGALYGTFRIEAYRGERQVFSGTGSPTGAAASSPLWPHLFDPKSKRPVR